MNRGTVLIAVSLGLSWLSAGGSLAQDLGSWRALTAGEETARVGDTSPDSVDPSMIEADFDGDGKKDKVLIAIRKTDGARGIVAVLNGGLSVVDPDGVELSDGLGLAEPGRWDTICGNAFREFHQDACDKGYPSRVVLKNPGILWIGNGRTVLFFWDRKAKRFDGVLMVD